jgi:hypothetical protein
MHWSILPTVSVTCADEVSVGLAVGGDANDWNAISCAGFDVLDVARDRPAEEPPSKVDDCELKDDRFGSNDWAVDGRSLLLALLSIDEMLDRFALIDSNDNREKVTFSTLYLGNITVSRNETSNIRRTSSSSPATTKPSPPFGGELDRCVDSELGNAPQKSAAAALVVSTEPRPLNS